MAAGPELHSTYTDLLLEAKGPLVENFPKYSVLLDQLKRVHPSRDGYDGTTNSVRVPILRNPKQGTALATESGTLVGPRNIRTTKANIGIVTISHIIQLSKRLKAVSKNDLTSWANALKLEMRMAEEAMPRTVNEMLNGNGDGLLAAVTSTTAASGGATQDIAVGTAANFYQLYPGRVVEVLTTSSLARVTGFTQAVRIKSFSESAGTITVVFDDDSATSAQTTNAAGIYIEGAASGLSTGQGTALQGIVQAAARTGTFETIDKAAQADWQGVDGRGGDTSSADLSISIMDGCIRRRGRNGSPDRGLWLSDEAVLDKFSQSLLTQSRWAGDKGQVSTGFKYVEYRDERLYPEYDAKRSRIAHVPLDDVTFYGTQPGPDWDDEDGNVFKRFARSLPTEAWLVDELQFGVHRCNRFVTADNLNSAS